METLQIMIVTKLLDAATFSFATAEGLMRGLLPWALVGFGVSYVTVALQGIGSDAHFTDNTIISFTSGAVSLLVGFLVSNNINTSLMITSTVAEIQGLCMELASLSHAFLSEKEECSLIAQKLELTACEVLELILTNGEGPHVTSVDTKIFEGFKSVKTAKERNLIEAELCGIFSRTLSGITTKYDSLLYLRNIGTPPALRSIVYILGMFNVVQYVTRMSDKDDATRIAIGTFVASATVGVLATSDQRDPLDSYVLKRQRVSKSVRSTISQIEKLTDCRTVPQASVETTFVPLYLPKTTMYKWR